MNRATPVLSAKVKPVTQDKLVLHVPDFVRLQHSQITQNNGYKFRKETGIIACVDGIDGRNFQHDGNNYQISGFSA